MHWDCFLYTYDNEAYCSDCLLEKLDKENQKYKEKIDKAIDKIYSWGETLNPIFQKEILDILKEVDLMTEEKINENLIKFELKNICKNCKKLNELAPTIREMLSEEYRTGLAQARFDKIMLQQEIEKLNNEIEIGKEQYNDLVEEKEKLQEKIDLVLLKNQELKEQLENCYCNRTDCSSRIKESKQYDSLVQKVEKQQKEFIEWLENEIQKQKDYGASFGLTIDRDIAEYISEKIDVYKKVLSKYKSIIGASDE